MKEFLKLTISLCLTFFLLISCDNFNTKVTDKTRNTNIIKASLIEKQIGTSNYYISIPKDYSITLSNGIDFSVYYFSPINKKVKNKLRGGIYFGNHPSGFTINNDSCKTDIIKGQILGNIEDWTLYFGKKTYFIQTIADNKNHENWDRKIHAFGYAKNKQEIDTILEIYSTLRKK